MGFEFNKAYVIESLGKERKTGEELYNDLLRYKEYQIPDFTAQLFQPHTKAEFIDCLETIKDDIVSNGIYPIIHLELHGNKSGIGLASGEFISWSELYDLLVDLNVTSNFNLFLSMGVCMGGYLMQEIKIDRPAPFWGFIGSFETLYNTDIIIRYTEFYTELLTSFDLNNAFDQLKSANTGFPADYRFITSETTFQNVYKKYAANEFTTAKVNARFKSALKESGHNIKDRNQHHRFRVQFQVQLNRTKKDFYNEHKRKFFLIDTFPENDQRFLNGWNPF